MCVHNFLKFGLLIISNTKCHRISSPVIIKQTTTAGRMYSWKKPPVYCTALLQSRVTTLSFHHAFKFVNTKKKRIYVINTQNGTKKWMKRKTQKTWILGWINATATATAIATAKVQMVGTSASTDTTFKTYSLVHAYNRQTAAFFRKIEQLQGVTNSGYSTMERHR